VMARSDCFVLSSDYEGQPIALLESLVLELPIITTDFDTVRDVLPHGAGIVVARDVEALAEGMRAFLRGEIRKTVFDSAAYNQAAMQEFYRAIGADSPAGSH
jgi:CDP-glycerol glycerophosphotransferase